jgi:hypothetical protein
MSVLEVQILASRLAESDYLCLCEDIVLSAWSDVHRRFDLTSYQKDKC